VPILALGFPGINGIEFNPFLSKSAYYLLVVTALSLVLAGKYLVLKTWFGRSIKAIREDEGLAKSIGIPTRKYKVLAFGISAGVAGLAGSLYGHYVSYLHPELFNFVTSFRFLMMNRIGGLGSLLGPVFGSMGLTIVEEFTHPLNSYLAQLVFSVILITTLLYFPEGLAGVFRKALAGILPRRFVRTPGVGEKLTAEDSD
jgi:branched-chain amino acid transport system permease protein